MVDDVNNITETAESQAAAEEALDRSRLARERREAEQRKRLEELRAHAAAAQAQRERRDEERRRRQAELRARDDYRRQQVEERKRAIWEASVSRREALVMRERERAERLDRARAARSAPRPAFAFGSSTPRLLEPIDSGGFFWAARRAASTSNVMFASAPLTRRASALQLDASDNETKDEPDRQPQAVVWSSVARRRTDLVPTMPASRAPGRAYSMTRLDKIPSQRPLHSTSPSMHHLNRTQTRSGETTPSRPGSALSTAAGVVRRATSAPRKPRPASIAGTGVNTPRGPLGGASVGGGDSAVCSAATTPGVSRDGSALGAGDVPRRAASTPRRPRPASLHVTPRTPAPPVAPGEGKPPLHRKPKTAKDIDRGGRGKSLSVSPGRTLSPSPGRSKEPSVDKDLHIKTKPAALRDVTVVHAAEVTHKLEALQINAEEGDKENENLIAVETKTESEKRNEMKTEENKVEENLVEMKNAVENQIDTQKTFENKIDVHHETKEIVEEKPDDKTETETEKPLEKKEEIRKVIEKKEYKVEEKSEEKKESSQEKSDNSEMTASMTGRRITTEDEAKAALAERRRRAREELERQAELERQRLQREAEEEAERQRLEEERQRREEEEARELAALQRRTEEEKLRKAIEAQQQLEREEAERKSREESERQARLKEDEEKRKAAEEAEKLRREEAEKEEKERLLRKQRVEAIMARTRLKKAEEDKKNQEKQQSDPQQPAPTPAVVPAPVDNGNATSDLLGLDKPTEQTASESTQQPIAPAPVPAENGNAFTGDLLGLDTAQLPVSNTELVRVPLTAETTTNNGNLTADLLGLSAHNDSEDKPLEQPIKQAIDNAPTNAPTLETNNVKQNGRLPDCDGFMERLMSANEIDIFLNCVRIMVHWLLYYSKFRGRKQLRGLPILDVLWFTKYCTKFIYCVSKLKKS